jgi:hypothetical protein
LPELPNSSLPFNINQPLQNKQQLEESMTTTVINKGTSPIKFKAGAVGSDITHEMIHALVTILGPEQ